MTLSATIIMTIDKKEIEKIATLAKLTIDTNMISTYTKDMNHIFDMIQTINKADTKNIDADISSQQIDHLRDDHVTEDNQREELQKNATAKQDGYYVVPKVIS